ncbi:MAG: hypothetical protein ACTSXA_13835 [Candidatus Heimdallarchaeota archaeon]
MKINKIKSLTISIMAILIATFIISNNSNLMPTTIFADAKSDAFDAIVEAYGKIEQATSKGLDVKTQINLLNDALDDYNNGQYTDALNKAQEVIDQTDELLETITVGQLFPYILIPVNAVLIIAIFVFFRRNIVNWFKGRRDDEFLDMEIIYEEPEVVVNEEEPMEIKEK